MNQLCDFWGEPLSLNDWVIYCHKQRPRLGRIVKLHKTQVTIQEQGGLPRDARWERLQDLRTPKHVVRVNNSPALTARLLKSR